MSGDRLIETVLGPFVAVLEGSSMMFWPFLLAAAALAFTVPLITAREGYAGEVRRQFSRHIWWSPSSKADYAYYVINGIAFPLIFAPVILTSYEVGQAVSAALGDVFGSRADAAMGETELRIAYTVAFFLAYDLGRYLAHLAQHRVPLLWQFHKVHHSAEALTPITSFRLHPVDLLVMALGANLFGGVLTGVFLYLGAGAISAYTFLGLHIGIGFYNLIGNLRHSHVWLDYGPLSYVLISPAQHQIHHSALEKHRDRNCGFAFAFWDLAFGTLYVPKEREEFPMGLGDGTDGRWHSVPRLYAWPVAMAARLLGGKPPVP